MGRYPDLTVACYYFPNYHPDDPRNVAEHGCTASGDGWSEWELVKAARPRFPGHRQPRVPLWGYTDESDPADMTRAIDTAADHGVDAFIFDWYWYDDGPFLNRALDWGYGGCANRERVKFALMWANHDWIDIHPYRRDTPRRTLYPGVVTPDTFDEFGNYIAEQYFAQPSYWRVDGAPYFSIYELSKLVASFGSVEATREALDGLRAKTVAAGQNGLHLNAVVWGNPILPGEQQPADPARLVADLGFDSVTSYVWIHHVGLPELQTDYDWVRDRYFEYWDRAESQFGVPYYPNVTVGWDSSPRAHQDDEFANVGYPFIHTIGGNTPARFGEALRRTVDRLGGRGILNLNCWNEWTEGSCLEPDTEYGLGYLEALRAVVGGEPS